MSEVVKTKPVVPPGMHTDTVNSLGIADLIEYAAYNDVAEIDKVGGPGTACTLANAYMRQKEALVDGRDAIVKRLIELTKFGWDPAKEKTKTVDGKTVKYNSETEGQWFARFKPAVLAGKVPTFVAADEATFETKVVAISRELGPFIISAAKSVREAKAKTPPDYALNGAISIIANGSQAKWVTIFQTGDKLAGPVAFNPFMVVPPPGSTPEIVAATAESNKVNLAWAIKAREDDKRARQAKKEYV